MTDTRDAYREAIQSLARERKGKPFPSATPQHASIAVETLFLLSQQHVRILTGRVDRPIFSDPVVINAARRFLSTPGATISVILGVEDFGLPLFSDLPDARDLIRIFSLPAAVSDPIPYRFVVGDEDMYRFEGEKDDLAGIAAFGDKKFCTHLIEIFDQLLKVATIRAPVPA
jgi:hypothetical protein